MMHGHNNILMILIIQKHDGWTNIMIKFKKMYISVVEEEPWYYETIWMFKKKNHVVVINDCK